MTKPNTGYAYQLGVTRNRTSVTELTGRTLNWTYNGVYQLTNEAISSDPSGVNGSVAYGVDPVGNRVSSASSVAGVMSGILNYNLDDQLLTETYDANGNALVIGGKTFAYDSENRLQSMNGGAVNITYDGFGNRVAETANGVITRYLVEDDVNPTGFPQVMEEITNGAVTRIYTYGLQRISQNQSVSSNWIPSFYGYDGMSSVRQLTNLPGSVTDTYEYDAFGNLLLSTGTTANSYLYRGDQYDQATGLYYLRARFYNPATGRFVSRDRTTGEVTDPTTLHKYLYAGGDPIDKIDPSGNEALPGPGTPLAPLPPGPTLVPPSQPNKVKASGGEEYAIIVGLISLPASLALPEVREGVECVINDASTLLRGLSEDPTGQIVSIVPDGKCGVKVNKCKTECDPGKGTQCYDEQSGHSHGGFDPHFHLYTINQNPKDCSCHWNKQRLNDGAVGERPITMNSCSVYSNSGNPWVPTP